ncbi:MAG: 2'-5' RNA ligase family protein [Anaerolineae bacterium]|nr:2'-5' RNA ligase family protein [Anaerolineae bacterium]
MKATFALLADTDASNFVRKLAWEIHRKHRTGTSICRLLPHVSLKQLFEIEDVTRLENYMDEFAQSVHPFEMKCTELQLRSMYYEGMEIGILWLDVQETAYLRQLHDRLNRELAQRFENTQAAFDGEGYHFHMTVMMGGQTIEVYRRIFDELSEREVNLTFTARTLAMFVYDEPLGLDGEYMTYKILSLG